MVAKYANYPNTKPKDLTKRKRVAENIDDDWKYKNKINLLAKLMGTNKDSKEQAQILKRLGNTK